ERLRDLHSWARKLPPGGDRTTRTRRPASNRRRPEGARYTVSHHWAGSRTPRSANKWIDVDDVPVDVMHLVFDRGRGRSRQRGLNGGREVAREPGSAFGADVDTQPSRGLVSGG